MRTLEKGHRYLSRLFDPPTNGHLDLIDRGSKIFDELVVAILRNPDKNPLFSLGERRAMLEALTADIKNVRVDVFDGLTVDYAARVKASACCAASARSAITNTSCKWR